MSRILIKEAKKQATGEVTVAGFVNNVRAHKGVIFVDLRDISDYMQLVFVSGNDSYEIAEKLQLESVIQVTGELQEKPSKKGEETKDFELLVSEAEIVSLSDESLPISVLQKADNEANLDNRLNWRWLDLRRPENQTIFKLWTKLEQGFRDYWMENDYIQIYTPAFMNTASESGSEVFEVKYFDKKAYLAQSPQFYKQMALAAGLEKVFVMGSVFRAEPSFTSRHLTEFTGWDFEMSYIESHLDVMAAEEGLMVSGFRKVKEDLDIDIEVPTVPFPRMTMAEAKAKLKEVGVPSEKDFDLSPEEERTICEIVKKEHNHDFVFITDYPIDARPFYHMRYEDRPEITKSFDLLYRGVEITTGAQREHRIDVLEKQAIEKGMDLEELKNYIDFFRYGCPSHGGAGIGPARIIMKILGLNNIKEATFLPRDVKRLLP